MKNIHDLYKKYLEMQGNGQSMKDGGKVESDDSVMSNLADAFQKAFSTPKPQPTPDPTLQDKYDKIRQQNRKNFESPGDQPLFDGGISGSTHKYQYSDGGLVEIQTALPPQSQDEKDAESEEITKREDSKKLQDDEESKPFNKGGKVPKKKEHNLNNLKDLKKAFDKFIAEEGSEKMSSGGKVGSGERFAKLENKLSHQKGVTNPAALAASIGRKKYGNKKMNKMANAHMNQGGSITGFIPEGNIKHYAQGGEINKAAPNNGKLPYYIPHDNIELYKRYLALNNPEAHFDQGTPGAPVSKYANDPNYQAWKAANPNVPGVVADLAYENSMSKGSQDAAMPAAPAQASPTPYQNFANYAVNGQGQGMADGGVAGDVPQDPIYPDLTPEQEAANAAELAQLKANGAGQEQIQGDEQMVSGANPTKIADVEMSENPDDKALEEEMTNEDFKSEEAANDNNPEKKRELASDEESDDSEDEETPEDSTVRHLPGMTLKAEEALKENPQSDAAAGLQVSPDLQKMIDFTKNNKNDLTQAQKERDANILGQEVAKYGALAGAGLAGRNGTNVSPNPALGVISSNDKNVGLPVQKYEEQIANQQNDPNSPMSQVVKQYMTSKGLQVPPTASASDLYKVAPFLAKDAALQTAIQKVVMQQTGANSRADLSSKTKKEIADSNQKAAMERELEANKGRVAAAKASQETKQANNEKSAEVKAENAMSTTRGKQAVMMAQRNLVSIQNAQKMLEEFPDTDKWTPSQVQLFNTEVGKIASGGVPTEGQMNELSNPTLASHMAQFAQKLANVPVGANQGKFIELNKKYLQGLGDVAHGIIRDNVGNTAKSYQNSMNPDAYKNMLYRHSDMLGLYNPNEERGINAVMQAKGLSRQDAIKALINQGVIKDVNY